VSLLLYNLIVVARQAPGRRMVTDLIGRRFECRPPDIGEYLMFPDDLSDSSEVSEYADSD
jgi:hypothetical protein